MKRFQRHPGRLIEFAHSMHAKVMIACFFAALAASVVSTLITYTAAVSVIQRNAKEQVTAVIEGANLQLDNYADEIENLALSIMTDKETVQKTLTAGASPIGGSWFHEWKTMRQYLEQMAGSQNAIDRIDLIGANKVYSTNAMTFFTTANGGDWSALWDLPSQWHYTPEDGGHLTLLRSIWVGRERIGLVRIFFDKDLMQAIYRDDLLPQGHAFVLTPTGEFVLNAGSEGASIHDTRYAPAFSGTEDLLRVDDVSYLVLRATSTKTGLVTVALVSNDMLLRDSMQLRTLIITTLVVLVVLSLFGAWFVSRQIIKNLHALEDAMQRVRKGDLSVQLNIAGHSEVARLGEVFQSMMDRIQALFQRISEQERERHLAELRALQAQIGPHFVCNTLSNIKYLAALQDAHNIEELAEALAEMMRVMLGNINDDITVEEEVRLLQNYVLIQKYRVYDRIQVHFQVEATILKALVPKLILQPILENAYMHGLAGAQEGVVFVNIFSEEGRLICEIADNGIGLSPEQMASVQSAAQGRSQPTMSGMGIQNVRQRIMLRWPETGTLSFNSIQGLFTSVRVVMPLTFGAADEEALHEHTHR